MAIVPSLPYADLPAFPDLPPLVLALLGDHLAPVLDWFTARVYGPMFARCADHPLIALKAWYDPAAVVAACAGFHHAPGTPGKPPDFTIEHLLRAYLEEQRATATTSDKKRSLKQIERAIKKLEERLQNMADTIARDSARTMSLISEIVPCHPPMSVPRSGSRTWALTTTGSPT